MSAFRQKRTFRKALSRSPNPALQMRRSLSDQRNLKVRRTVLFLIETAPIDVASAPEQHVAVQIDQVVLHEIPPRDQAERREGLAEHHLRDVYFPLRISRTGNLVENVGKSLGDGRDRIVLVCNDIHLPPPARARMIPFPTHLTANV